jgi:3-phosphoinositide dependent protein kinase-1
VDLIDKLMLLNPEQRLGAGQSGCTNDYEHLKSHPFFKTINYKRLQMTAPPIPSERFQSAFKTNATSA